MRLIEWTSEVLIVAFLLTGFALLYQAGPKIMWGVCLVVMGVALNSRRP